MQSSVYRWVYTLGIKITIGLSRSTHGGGEGRGYKRWHPGGGDHQVMSRKMSGEEASKDEDILN